MACHRTRSCGSSRTAAHLRPRRDRPSRAGAVFSTSRSTSGEGSPRTRPARAAPTRRRRRGRSPAALRRPPCCRGRTRTTHPPARSTCSAGFRAPDRVPSARSPVAVSQRSPARSGRLSCRAGDDRRGPRRRRAAGARGVGRLPVPRGAARLRRAEPPARLAGARRLRPPGCLARARRAGRCARVGPSGAARPAARQRRDQRTPGGGVRRGIACGGARRARAAPGTTRPSTSPSPTPRSTRR